MKLVTVFLYVFCNEKPYSYICIMKQIRVLVGGRLEFSFSLESKTKTKQATTDNDEIIFGQWFLYIQLTKTIIFQFQYSNSTQSGPLWIKHYAFGIAYVTNSSIEYADVNNNLGNCAMVLSCSINIYWNLICDVQRLGVDWFILAGL